jgi:hypothetical protein
MQQGGGRRSLKGTAKIEARDGEAKYDAITTCASLGGVFRREARGEWP